MKGLITLVLLIPISWMIPAASAEERDRSRYEGPVVIQSGEVGGIVSTSWNRNGKYGYYGRGDHRHRGDPYFDRHRRGYGYSPYYDHRSPYRPHPFSGKGFYHRHHQGGHFGFSACYRSGSTRICFNESRPYRHR